MTSFKKAYNRIFSRRTVDTQHEADCELVWQAAIKQAITIVESCKVSVGNSAAGEIAAELTMGNLCEVRDELWELLK